MSNESKDRVTVEELTDEERRQYREILELKGLSFRVFFLQDGVRTVGVLAVWVAALILLLITGASGPGPATLLVLILVGGGLLFVWSAVDSARKIRDGRVEDFLSGLKPRRKYDNRGSGGDSPSWYVEGYDQSRHAGRLSRRDREIINEHGIDVDTYINNYLE